MCWVVEVYLDTPGGASVSPAALVSERFISTSSLTKACGLAGVRCGWAWAAPGIAARMRARRRIVSNRIRVPRTFAGRDDVASVLPAAGTVAFPKLLRVADVDGFVDRLLVEHHTAVVPGRFFGHHQHVRVAFGMGAEELSRWLDAVADALDAAARLETARR